MSSNNSNNINVAAADNTPEEAFEFILTLPEAAGFMEMDPDFWDHWQGVCSLKCRYRMKDEHTMGLLYQAHVLAEQFHFAKARKAGLPEMEKAEKQWIIASILSKLAEHHFVAPNALDCRYPYSYDEEWAKESERVPARYRNSKNANNRKVFPFMEGKGMERKIVNPYAPPRYYFVEINTYE